MLFILLIFFYKTEYLKLFCFELTIGIFEIKNVMYGFEW